MKRILILFIIIFCLLSYAKAQITENRILTPAQMKEDFSYLRKVLEDTHPGLYAYQSKEVMQHKMDSLYALLNKQLPFYQFYGVIANLIADIGCEHTSCSPYPATAFQAKVFQYKLIPFAIQFVKHKAYVVINRTADTSIYLGDEIISINQHLVDSLEQVLYKYIPAEAGIASSREHILSTSMAFNLLYYLFIERPESFRIVFRSADGRLKEREFTDKLTVNENEKMALSNPNNKKILALIARNEKEAKDNLNLKTISKQTAILTVRTFSGNKKKMYDDLAKAFTTLNKNNPQNLIIDLSYNPGGDEAQAAELLSYIISKPTRFITSEYLINDQIEYLKMSNLPKEVLTQKEKFIEPQREGKFMVRAETQGELEIIQPKPNRFMGKVYICINSATASAASTFAAVAKSNRLATLVGEETGGSFFGGGSSTGLNLILPNTGVTAHTSIVYSVFATQGNYQNASGVLPDHQFKPTFDELASGNKSWINFTLNLINNEVK